MANNIIQIIVYASFLIYTDIQTISLFALGGIVMFFPTRFLLKQDIICILHTFAQENRKRHTKSDTKSALIKILRTSKAELELYNNTIAKYQTGPV